MRRADQASEPEVTPVAAATADGVRLSGLLLAPKRKRPEPARTAIVVGHGFTNHIRRQDARLILCRLAGHAAVLAMDFRGHGRSGGGSTVGGTEILDIAAAVATARRRGYRRVVALGFSMGGSAVLRHAALHEPAHERPAAVASVSSPARWWARDTAPMRRLNLLLELPPARVLSPLFGVRLGPEWGHNPPVSPIDVVHRIAPIPLLIMHGDADHYFPAEHGHALHAAAGAGARLWLEPGMAHAESAMTPERVDRLARWLITPG